MRHGFDSRRLLIFINPMNKPKDYTIRMVDAFSICKLLPLNRTIYTQNVIYTLKSWINSWINKKKSLRPCDQVEALLLRRQSQKDIYIISSMRNKFIDSCLDFCVIITGCLKQLLSCRCGVLCSPLSFQDLKSNPVHILLV